MKERELLRWEPKTCGGNAGGKTKDRYREKTHYPNFPPREKGSFVGGRKRGAESIENV